MNREPVDEMLDKQDDDNPEDDIAKMLLETCDHKTCIGYYVETEYDGDGTPSGQMQHPCPCDCHNKVEPINWDELGTPLNDSEFT